MSEVEGLLHKSERSFSAAGRLLADGDSDFAASRLYYGCFYIAEALLLSEGLHFSRHGQVMGAYGRLFAKEEHLPIRFHGLLDRTFELRQVADYTVEVRMQPSEIDDLISEGREFLQAAREYLAQQSGGS